MRLKLRAPDLETYEATLVLLKEEHIFAKNEKFLVISTGELNSNLILQLEKSGIIISEEIKYELD